jgi:hypothetical protein
MSGKLSLIYRVTLGLVFHLIFLSLLLAPLGFALGLIYRETFPGLRTRVADGGWICLSEADNCDFATSNMAWLQLAIAVMVCLAVVAGLASITVRFSSDSVRTAVQAWSLRFLVVPLLLSLLIIWLPAILAALRNLEDEMGSGGAQAAQLTTVASAGGTSLATVLLGILLHLRSRVEGAQSVVQDSGALRQLYTKFSRQLRIGFTYLAGAVAGPVLLLAIVTAAALVTVREPVIQSWHWWLVGLALGLFWFIYERADLTTWSLHPMYRRRLATAFALRRVKGEPDVDGPRGRAEERPYEELPLLTELASPSGSSKPTLIVCAAANISNPGATPPGRGVTSFTFSRTSIGGPLVGAVPSDAYLEALSTKRKKDFTLMAAVAMSGAALSPSMGKLTRRPLTFLMALANIRLGVWIPNPRRLEEWTAGSIPRPRPSYLVRELLGWNTINAKYLYVTDGGHYENLGLVELLRRGCTDIYCFDASGGKPGTFSELGDAIALARSELGCEVIIDPSELRPLDMDGELLAKADCVLGTIKFQDGTRGRIAYARTVLTKDAPWDVHAFHATDPRFPNHPTADQLYTDQKFEAYRALGHLAGENAMRLMKPPQRKLAVVTRIVHSRLLTGADRSTNNSANAF